jgi:transmembrane 9 superfamily protein 2/4
VPETLLADKTAIFVSINARNLVPQQSYSSPRPFISSQPDSHIPGISSQISDTFIWFCKSFVVNILVTIRLKIGVVKFHVPGKGVQFAAALASLSQLHPSDTRFAVVFFPPTQWEQTRDCTSWYCSLFSRSPRLGTSRGLPSSESPRKLEAYLTRFRSYENDEPIQLFVNKVVSDKSELPYAYYDLPFVCPPTGKKTGSLISGSGVSMNLGEVLRGDRIKASDYELKMDHTDQCHALCTHTIDANELNLAKKLIADGYAAEWIVDNLPGATSFLTNDKKQKYYATGFKIGRQELSKETGKIHYLLHNHVTMLIRWRNTPKGKVIVGFEVFPKSMSANNRTEGCPGSFENEDGFVLEFSESNSTALEIPYSYSVYYREDNSIEWANRWDPYFINQEPVFHWIAIFNALLITASLAGVVAVIFARSIRSDFDEKDIEEDDVSGWKLLHGDVFRPPPYGGLLAPLVGSGMQLLVMFVGTVSLSALGVINPSWRGGYVSVGYFLFVCAGLFSGYFSARLYKTFGGQNWRKNTLITAVLFPGMLFALVFFLNIFVWAQSSSIAMPLGTLIALAFLWLFIQVPLVYLGSWVGYVKSKAWEPPTKTTLIARQIPAQPWYLETFRSILLGGLIPFGIIVIELIFIFKSLWQDKSSHYYMFGFLAIISFILLVSVIEVTIIVTYMRLCAEDHAWHWKSFSVAAGGAFWAFVYCLWYYFARLQVQGFVSSLLYFGYSLMACSVFGLLTGTVGFLASFVFLRRIYASIKVD